LDRTLDSTDEGRVFAAADIAWLGYKGHLGTSGVLVLAGLAGLPVIGCVEGEIGFQVRRDALGEVVEVCKVDSVRAALARLSDPVRRGAYGANGQRIFASHSSARFKLALQAALEPEAA